MNASLQTPAVRFTPYTSAIRALAMDAVQKAASGHPGMPMGMAEIAEVLWTRHLRHNPAHPAWSNRDRFVLSNGHGSMLLYSLLHLSGYDLPMAELQRFRQLHAKTPGHPEWGLTPGVETTTGPLGQGLANAIGMALAERLLAQEFNRAGHQIIDHHTYVMVGDGCLMEGLSHEVCSLAGTWQLGKLIALYDDNGISIDGHVEGWFTDATPQRFAAYGWQVIADVDGHDPAAIDAAIRQARAETTRPSLICCKTVIGLGAPNKAGSHDVHGAPLGDAEIRAAREAIGWPHAPFDIPDEVYAHFDARARGADSEAEWNARFASYRTAYPELAAELQRRLAGDLPSEWQQRSHAFIAAVSAKNETIASRKASQNAIEALAPLLPELLGGSADLTGSNLTHWSGSRSVSGTAGGNYLHYGVREFGMAAIMNGLSVHGGFIPYGGTFLVFSDYARNALRMAALMHRRCVFVLTHDSIGLGEDGPTHQPIEHAASLRLIPGMDVWRPCDAVETAAAWVAAIDRHDGPSCLLLSRQNLPPNDRDTTALEGIARGGYVLSEAPGGEAQIVLIATGSEVHLAIAAQRVLAAQGVRARVVSMPSTNRFDRQDRAYRDSVLLRNRPRVAIEAGVTDGWYKYVGDSGAVLGIDRFGESAPAGELFKYFGLTIDHLVSVALTQLGAERMP